MRVRIVGDAGCRKMIPEGDGRCGGDACAWQELGCPLIGRTLLVQTEVCLECSVHEGFRAVVKRFGPCGAPGEIPRRG